MNRIVDDVPGHDPAGKLRIESDASLAINNSSSTFSGHASYPSIIEFIDGATTTNPGKLAFADTNANMFADIKSNATNGGGEIEVASGETLTLDSTSEVTVPGGNLTFDIIGSVQFDGDVTITAGHKVEIQGSGVAVGSSGTFTLNHASGELHLNHSTAGSYGDSMGDIDIQAGRLRVDTGFSYSGGLLWKGSAIVDCDDMDTAEDFSASGDAT